MTPNEAASAGGGGGGHWRGVMTDGYSDYTLLGGQNNGTQFNIDIIKANPYSIYSMNRDCDQEALN